MSQPYRLPEVRPTLAVPAPRDAGAPVPRLSSRALLAGGREVEIEHDQAVYRLRVTALGKLILTK